MWTRQQSVSKCLSRPRRRELCCHRGHCLHFVVSVWRSTAHFVSNYFKKVSRIYLKLISRLFLLTIKQTCMSSHCGRKPEYPEHTERSGGALDIHWIYFIDSFQIYELDKKKKSLNRKLQSEENLDKINRRWILFLCSKAGRIKNKLIWNKLREKHFY